MKFQGTTLNFTMVMIVGVMGILGLSLSILTGNAYSNLILENQKTLLQGLVTRKSDSLIDNLYSETRDLGFGLMSEDLFLDVYRKNPDYESLSKMLRTQLQRSIADDGILSVKQLAIYSKKLNLDGFASYANHHNQAICQGTLEKIKNRPKNESLLSVNENCFQDNHVMFSVIIPVGGLKPTGYLQIETDPTLAFLPLELELNMPIQINNPMGETLFQSKQWPVFNTDENILISQYTLHSFDGKQAFTIRVANDISSLRVKLEKTNQIIWVLSLFLTTITAVIALVYTNKMALSPLKRLVTMLNRIKKNKAHIGEKIPISGSVEIQEIITDFNEMTGELKNLYATLENLALTDQLTQLPNRVHLQDSVKSLIVIYEKLNLPFTLFLMDLDRFKQVNDTLGHHAGDELLLQVSNRLKTILRHTDFIARNDESNTSYSKEDVIARLGGDEFAVLLPMVTNPTQAMKVANDIIESVSKPYTIEGSEVTIDISIGAAFYPQHGKSSAELLKKADAAMYVAKRNKSGIVVFSETMKN